MLMIGQLYDRQGKKMRKEDFEITVELCLLKYASVRNACMLLTPYDVVFNPL